jgi:GNAT superfamily N-acetyltransferase
VTGFTIRKATFQDDLLIAQHFYKMWLDVGVPDQAIASNWQDIILEFVENARLNLFYQGFVAEIDYEAIGSASCQLFAGLYPNALQADYRKYGYIWGIYVEPSYRRQGVAKQLTSKTIEYLKEIGCTWAILNASPSGKPVYESLGFTENNGMQLDLTVVS